jgi:hypothetical protein
MVLALRIAALEQYALAGHLITITYSYAANTSRIKAKVFVSAECNIVKMEHRNALLAIVQPLYMLTSFCVSVDRGHTYSDGHACACFWMQPPNAAIQNDVGANVEDVLDYLQPTSAVLNPEAKEFFPPVLGPTSEPTVSGTRRVKMVSFSERLKRFLYLAEATCRRSLPSQDHRQPGQTEAGKESP